MAQIVFFFVRSDIPAFRTSFWAQIANKFDVHQGSLDGRTKFFFQIVQFIKNQLMRSKQNQIYLCVPVVETDNARRNWWHALLWLTMNEFLI